MEKTVIKVEGMSCEHCVKAITNSIGSLPGVDEVSVDLAAGTVTAVYDCARTPLDRIKAEIEDLGYEII